MPTTPLTQYLKRVESGLFQPDPEQQRAAEALEDLWQRLQEAPGNSLIDRVRRRKSPPVKGLYLWGSVGRGKTWLMDLFYDQLPLEQKQRIHFHRFMRRVHDSLRKRANERDPLQRIAEGWARKYRVLCLDEFFVSDIADAMLLAGLLETLFSRGVTLVTTSNIAPDHLYRDGLQRARFLPAIELLKEHTEVLELGGHTDFRLRILEQSTIYHTPLDHHAEKLLASSFNQMSADCVMAENLKINGRSFHARRRGDGIIWFDFEELCGKPRGSHDYIEIARAFNTVLLSGIPLLTAERETAARRFIMLVDEFYDRNVKLLISAEAPADRLYQGKKLAFEYQRTQSRLTEMQSHRYLSQPHLP